MLELGYLKQTKKGAYDRQRSNNGPSRSRLTRYSATDLLIDKFTKREQEVLPVIVPPVRDDAPIRVRLKHADKPDELFPADDGDEVRRMTQNLALINRVLETRWYDLLIPDADLAELQERLADDPAGGKPLGMHRRNLYRVFNDRELTTGGRFYGGWWQSVPKAYRRHLAVNGKRMVEIDYSNLHPVILYAEAGVTPPDDCYRGIFSESTEARGGDALRNLVKASFNAMLNAEKPLRQAPRSIDLREFGLTWKLVSEAILSAHGPIADKFYTGAGKRLQRTDSDVAELVMLDFIGSGIPILPVHDSFLVHEGHREFLTKSMQASLVKVCGVKTQLKLVEPDPGYTLANQAEEQGNDPDGFGPETSLDIAEILLAQSGHDKRLDAFYALRNH